MSTKRATVTPTGSRKLRRTVSKPRINRGYKMSVARSMSAPKVHVIMRTVSIQQQVSASGIVPQVGTVSSQFFSLWFTNQNAYIWINASNYSTSAIPGYTDLAALFDEIKIAAIEISIISGTDPNPPGGAGQTGSAVLVMATDYNDKNAPTSAGDVQQYADAKNVRLTNNFVHKEILYPKFLTYSLDSGGAAIASTPKQGFIRSNLDIEHNGKKCAILLNSPATMFAVFSFKYKFICKTAK